MVLKVTSNSWKMLHDTNTELSQLVFVSNGGLLLWSLANNASKPISTGDAYPTVAAPPAWQP